MPHHQSEQTLYNSYVAHYLAQYTPHIHAKYHNTMLQCHLNGDQYCRLLHKV